MADSLVALCFFFQAEDGIRDKLVTGVQTCALPICGTEVQGEMAQDPELRRLFRFAGADAEPAEPDPAHAGIDNVMLRRSLRSEERRVGKECRSRWSPYH